MSSFDVLSIPLINFRNTTERKLVCALSRLQQLYASALLVLVVSLVATGLAFRASITAEL